MNVRGLSVKPSPLESWYIMRPSDMGEYVTQLSCVAHDYPLTPVITLVGEDTMRVGVCDMCGYTTYMEKPPKSAIQAYYRSHWMKEEGALYKTKSYRRSIRKVFGRSPRQKKEQAKSKVRRAIMEKLKMEENCPVLEVGCGMGKDIYLFKKLGFRYIWGIENSKERANAVEKVYNVPVFCGPVEEFETELQFGLITSKHVLEHTYNPDEVIAKLASLQDDGGFLLLSLPNFSGEPSFGITSFFPHLHSFTPRSLHLLLAKHGYTVIEDYSTERENYVLAKKGETGEGGYVKQAIEKFTRELAIENGTIKTKHGEVEATTALSFKTDSPIEIQFEGDITLYAK